MPIYNQNGASFRVFQDSRQGGRKYMEDVVCLRDYKSDDGEQDFLYFAVFDGHGGVEAARFAREHLLDELKNIRGFWTQDKEEISKAVKEAFLSTHKLMWKNVGTWPKTLSGLPSTAGTTASVVLIKAGYMFIAHVGDSSVVLGEENYWRTLHANCVTVDHKPESPIELKRIEDSGGQVMCKAGVQRVVWHRPKPAHKGPIRRSTHIDDIPFLAVARALGDLWSYNSERDTFVVSPEPDITVYKFNPERHKFLIIASDGLWNMVKPEESVGYVEQLIEEEEPFTLGNNPARKLVQLALNKWAFRNMRADNTSVIAVMVDPPMTDDQFNISRTNSRASSASTVRLSEADTDIVSDQDMDISANIEVAAPVPSRNALPPIRPSPHHIGFFHPHAKHHDMLSGNINGTPIRSAHLSRPRTPGSAPSRCNSDKMHKIHKTVSMKRRGHSFWAGTMRPQSGDKVLIPTKYKHPEDQARYVATKFSKTPKPNKSSSKTITPTKYRSPEDQAKRPPPKRPSLLMAEYNISMDAGDVKLTPSKFRMNETSPVSGVIPTYAMEDGVVGGEDHVVDREDDADEMPGNISRSDPPNDELPELNKIIVPSKYKVSATPPGGVSSADTSSTLTVLKCRTQSSIAVGLISKISPLQGTRSAPLQSTRSALLGGKRKASLSIDCSNIVSKKARRSSLIPKSESAPIIVSSQGLAHITNNSESPKMATSAKSPLKLTTSQESPSMALVSPIWPGCLDKDIDMDAVAADSLCTHPVGGSQVCRSVLRENVPELEKPKTVNYARLSKKSFGAQNSICRSKPMARSQAPRLIVKGLRLRTKRPMKLRNTTKHRTRLQVKATVTRKC